MNNDKNTFLSNKVTIADYRNIEKAKDKQAIAEFIFSRFTERYIEPFEKQSPKNKHGFSLMAVSCLMVEALMSFRLGYNDTNGRSQACFEDFFKTANHFSDFKESAGDFYRNVRCGILHQAESTGGWRIWRKGPLFDKANLIVNATEFMARLKAYLKDYQTELEKSDWDSIIWHNFRKKMHSIIKNCKGK
ncbi:hypothetical protein HQ585_04805 [candidate division KSB1 bacterium]|nr:hypothetical protein [candidate division KSB1 bacterium]